MDIALTQAQQLINYPTKTKTDWIVKFFDDNCWKTADFTLIEDAWAFFYSKLNELKTKLLAKNNQRSL